MQRERPCSLAIYLREHLEIGLKGSTTQLLDFNGSKPWIGFPKTCLTKRNPCRESQMRWTGE